MDKLHKYFSHFFVLLSWKQPIKPHNHYEKTTLWSLAPRNSALDPAGYGLGWLGSQTRGIYCRNAPNARGKGHGREVSRLIYRGSRRMDGPSARVAKEKPHPGLGADLVVAHVHRG